MSSQESVGTDERRTRVSQARRSLNPNEPDPLLGYEFDRGTDYETDLHLTEAMLAFVGDDDLIGPDHRFFQTVHLITEYSWCAMHHEIRRAIAALSSDDYLLAAEVLDRAVGLGATPIHMVRLMLRHLPQYSLLHMRAALPPSASGLDSPGARNLRRASVALWRAFESALDRGDVTLVGLYEASGADILGVVPSQAHRGLSAVRDGMHRLDISLQEWRDVHLKLTWTSLGGHPAIGGRALAQAEEGLPTSLRGRPISDLERIAARPMFPALWQRADEAYRAATA